MKFILSLIKSGCIKIFKYIFRYKNPHVAAISHLLPTAIAFGAPGFEYVQLIVYTLIGKDLPVTRSDLTGVQISCLSIASLLVLFVAIILWDMLFNKKSLIRKVENSVTPAPIMKIEIDNDNLNVSLDHYKLDVDEKEILINQIKSKYPIVSKEDCIKESQMYIDQIKQKKCNQLPDSFRLNSEILAMFLPTDKSINNYLLNKYPEWLEDGKKWLQTYLKYKNNFSHRCTINFELTNIGNATANDVLISFKINHGGVYITTENDLNKQRLLKFPSCPTSPLCDIKYYNHFGETCMENLDSIIKRDHNIKEQVNTAFDSPNQSNYQTPESVASTFTKKNSDDNKIEFSHGLFRENYSTETFQLEIECDSNFDDLEIEVIAHSVNNISTFKEKFNIDLNFNGISIFDELKELLSSNS